MRNIFIALSMIKNKLLAFIWLGFEFSHGLKIELSF